eukprot:scaffold7691_cov267-Pinguiococcus_pyrenoidosus.AAC.2
MASPSCSVGEGLMAKSRGNEWSAALEKRGNSKSFSWRSSAPFKRRWRSAPYLALQERHVSELCGMDQWREGLGWSSVRVTNRGESRRVEERNLSKGPQVCGDQELQRWSAPEQLPRCWASVRTVKHIKINYYGF